MFRFIRERLRLTLAFKLGFLVLASTGAVFLLAFTYSNYIARGLMLEAVEENTRNLARSTVNRIEALLREVQPLPQSIAHHIASEPHTEQEITRMIHHVLRASPHIYGSAVAYAPDEFTKGVRSFAPYVYRKNGGFSFKNLGNANYDYGAEDWYLIPRELGKAIWTDPYYDEGGGETMMCTYSVPLFRESNGQRVFVGVVTADVQLEHLVEIVSSIKLYKTGYAFLLSQNGQFICHPNQDYVFKESIFSLADDLGEKQWRQIGIKMLRGGEGLARSHMPNSKSMSWLYYAPVSSGWSVGILFPEDEILANLQAMNRVVFWIGAIGFGLLLAVVFVLSRGVTRPIRTLALQTHEIARGNLDLMVPPLRSRDEVGDLSQSFENMRLALKEYVANLASTSAAKERIESELKIARTIQRSFLPKRFPPFPDRTEFDIYATLQAAKEVGGDLYDFFLLDENRLFFSIGDVSGKGVPAALFMAVAKTLMKGVAEQKLTPSQVLTKVNHELYVDNEQMLFVTVFCGILDLRTGELQFTNAGHPPPLLVRQSSGVSWLDLPKGVLLGVTEKPEYETWSITLGPQDKLFIYTDGVTEARSATGDFFGDDRLRVLVEKLAGSSPKELVEGVVAEAQNHTGKAPQWDDITALCIRYHGHA
ncbi:MAG: SpoIIE family protein phosphatase [Verrucomicrobia bacterium]|nr:SpoIIE family protein phosphatase [Verrucomicrobiota bacterium]